MHKILLVDDEENVLRALKRALATEPYEIVTCRSGVEALALLENTEVDLVLSDYRMPEMDGVAFLTECRTHRPDMARLILSGYADLEALTGAINSAQIYRFINKPWQDYDLKAAIFNALAHRTVLLDNRRLADQVRRQESQLNRQRRLLEQLEAEAPGITKVRWAEDGSVILNDEDGL